MKSTFVVTHLILGVTYGLAVFAALFELVPVSIVSLPVFFGFYTASGVLGIALHDYARAPETGHQPQTKAIHRAAPPPRDELLPVSTWHGHTLSA